MPYNKDVNPRLWHRPMKTSMKSIYIYCPDSLIGKQDNLESGTKVKVVEKLVPAKGGKGFVKVAKVNNLGDVINKEEVFSVPLQFLAIIP